MKDKIKAVLFDIDDTVWFREGPYKPAVDVMWELSKDYEIIYLSGRRSYPKYFNEVFPPGMNYLREDLSDGEISWKKARLKEILEYADILYHFDNNRDVVIIAEKMGINVILIDDKSVWDCILSSLKEEKPPFMKKNPYVWNKDKYEFNMIIPKDLPSKIYKKTELWEMGKEDFDYIAFHHGTGSEELGLDIPRFFTPSKEDAEWYANQYDNSVVITAYLDVKNPASFEDLQNIVKELGITESDINEYSDYSGENPADALYHPMVRKELIKRGFDGYMSSDPMMNYSIPIIVTLNDNQVYTHKRIVEDAISEGKNVPPYIVSYYKNEMENNPEKYLYHVTVESNLDNILKNGLKPKHDGHMEEMGIKQKVVNLCERKNIEYWKALFEMAYGEECVVLKVKVIMKDLKMINKKLGWYISFKGFNDVSISSINYDEIKKNPLDYEDYKEALAGEGWAINDYKDMIIKSDDEKEKKMLKHIMDEEEEHMDELLGLMKCKKNPSKNEIEKYVSESNFDEDIEIEKYDWHYDEINVEDIRGRFSPDTNKDDWLHIINDYTEEMEETLEEEYDDGVYTYTSWLNIIEEIEDNDFKPIILIKKEDKYILMDGFHRIIAYNKFVGSKIPAYIGKIKAKKNPSEYDSRKIIRRKGSKTTWEISWQDADEIVVMGYNTDRVVTRRIKRKIFERDWEYVYKPKMKKNPGTFQYNLPLFSKYVPNKELLFGRKLYRTLEEPIKKLGFSKRGIFLSFNYPVGEYGDYWYEVKVLKDLKIYRTDSQYGVIKNFSKGKKRDDLIEEFYEATGDYEIDIWIKNTLKKEGYEGIYYYDAELTTEELIIFDAKNLKLVNSGHFPEDEPNTMTSDESIEKYRKYILSFIPEMERNPTKNDNLLTDGIHRFNDGSFVDLSKEMNGTITINRIFVPIKKRGSNRYKEILSILTSKADIEGITLCMSIAPDRIPGKTKEDSQYMKIRDYLENIADKLGFKPLEMDGEVYPLDRIRKPRRNEKNPTIKKDSIITKNIHKKLEHYYKVYGDTPYQINHGWCIAFAADVIYDMGGETKDLYLLSSEECDEIPKENLIWKDDKVTIKGKIYHQYDIINKDFPLHTWIYYKGKHYDAETPEGVNKFYELSFFDDFMTREFPKMINNPTKKKRITAGCVIHNKKGEILLVHPTGHGWDETLGIPKGHLEKGETIEECAIRETKEEIGSDVVIEKYIGCVPHGWTGIVEVFLARLKYPDKCLNNKGEIKSHLLQREEVDWGGFLDIRSDIVSSKLEKGQREILHLIHEGI